MPSLDIVMLPLVMYARTPSAWQDAGITVNANNLLDYRSYVTSVINTYEVNPQLTPGPGREIVGTVRLTL